jgi:hypothetical protein
VMEMARSKRPKSIASTLPRPEPRATFRPKGGVPSVIVA